MSDIVDRLNDSLSAGYSELRKEAAQEILQLRKERDALRAELLDAKGTMRELFHGAGVANMTITTLRARIEAMEKQEPVAWLHETRRDSDVVTSAVKHVWGKAAVGAMAAYSIPLYTLPGAQPAPSVPECPYPCGWRNLLKLAIEDGAYLARSINEDEPVTENARAVTMRTVLRLRDVLMALNNAAPEAKP